MAKAMQNEVPLQALGDATANPTKVDRRLTSFSRANVQAGCDLNNEILGLDDAVRRYERAAVRSRRGVVHSLVEPPRAVAT
jgi:hypothetical protein